MVGAGDKPSASVRSQQRRIYAGTTDRPVSVFASAVAAPQTFFKPRVPSEADSFDVELDAPELNTIRSMAALPSGLLAFTSENVWQLYGQQGFGPGVVRADPLNLEGALELDPLNIRGAVLYIEAASQGVQRVFQEGIAESTRDRA